MLKSITKSQHIIPKNEVINVKSRLIFPEKQKLTIKNVKELRTLKIKNVWCIGTKKIGFTLSDGQPSKQGIIPKCFGHSFDPAKKITRVECFIDTDEESFDKISFYSEQQRLYTIGDSEDEEKLNDNRKEVFDIADDEVLIGCELDHD